MEDQLIDWVVPAAFAMMTKSDDLAGQAVSKPCSFTKLKTTPDYPIMLCVLSHHID